MSKSVTLNWDGKLGETTEAEIMSILEGYGYTIKNYVELSKNTPEEELSFLSEKDLKFTNEGSDLYSYVVNTTTRVLFILTEITGFKRLARSLVRSGDREMEKRVILIRPNKKITSPQMNPELFDDPAYQ